MPQQDISASCILPSAPTPFILEPVNTIHKLFGGKGNPSSLLSMPVASFVATGTAWPVASFVATGTACGRLRSLLAREGPAFPKERRSRNPSPQAPHPFPSALLSGKSQEYETASPPKTSGVCTACLSYLLKLFLKFVLTDPSRRVLGRMGEFEGEGPPFCREQKGFLPPQNKTSWPCEPNRHCR